MPKPDTALPAAALDHIPAQVLDKLPDVINPEPSVFVFHSTSADETLVGHTGQIDYFVYDVSTPQGTDFISGFEPSIDVLVFENALGFPAAGRSPDGDVRLSYPE